MQLKSAVENANVCAGGWNGVIRSLFTEDDPKCLCSIVSVCLCVFMLWHYLPFRNGTELVCIAWDVSLHAWRA